MSLRKTNEAIDHFSRAIQIAPQDAATHFHLANAFQLEQRTTEAIEHFRLALKFKSNWSFAANNLAWILATSQDSKNRNGQEAVRLAEMACRATEDRDPTTLATLAAAYAENNQFQEAIRTSQTAMAFAEKAGKTQLAGRLKERLSKYSKNQPWRE